MEVKQRVGTAILKANKREDERSHHQRSVALQSRRLELEVTPSVARYVPPAGAGVARYVPPAGAGVATSSTELAPAAPVKPQSPSQPDALRAKAKNKIGSSLLLRMAALTKREHAMGNIDVDAVRRYFPEWGTVTPDNWNDKPELRDLVLAVSQLSQHLYEEYEQSASTPR
tara:strand:- start:2245 stop:2757 length:513 start_codon:yes stop_codon:yes gene_type:complete